MNTLLPLSNFFIINPSTVRLAPRFRSKLFYVRASSNELDTKTVEENGEEGSIGVTNSSSNGATSSSGVAIDKDLKKVNMTKT